MTKNQETKNRKTFLDRIAEAIAALRSDARVVAAVCRRTLPTSGASA